MRVLTLLRRLFCYLDEALSAESPLALASEVD